MHHTAAHTAVHHPAPLTHHEGGGSSGGGGSGGGSDNGREGSDGSCQLPMGTFFSNTSSAGRHQKRPRRKQAEEGVVNPQARLLEFPAEVPSGVRDAILGFRPRAGCSIATVSKSSRSPIKFWGVRTEIGDGPFTGTSRKQKYFCLASSDCRKKQTVVAINAAQTSGATTHLKVQHKITSSVSETTLKRKAGEHQEVQEVLTSKPYNDNSDRFRRIHFVRTFIIHAACAFNLAEDSIVKTSLSVMTSGHMGVDQLNNKAIKKMIVEMYAATTEKFNRQILKDVRRALVPILYMNCDLWTSKVSQDKYIGVRIFYITEDMILRSYLLAVKLFQPCSALGPTTGTVVMKWVVQVLAQHGLRPSDFAGVVSDAGSDVSSGVGKSFRREWCLPHMLNRATIDGTGMANTTRLSKNLDCRALLEDAKKVIQHFNRSSRDKIAMDEYLEAALEDLGNGDVPRGKLWQAVIQRWVSLCKMLLRLLERWDAISHVYLNKGDVFPLGKRRDEFEEVYSILRVVKDVTLYCQSASEATAGGAMNRIVLLLTTTLEPMEDLEIIHVPVIGAAGGADVEGADGEADAGGADASDIAGASSRTMRSHTNLTETGRATREAFATAIGKRFLPRYQRAKLKAHPHLFDHAMFLSPGSRKMKYIDRLMLSSAAASLGLANTNAIKARVKDEVIGLVAKAVAEIRRKLAAERVEVDVSTAPRTRTPRTVAEGSERVKKLQRANLVDSGSDDDSSNDEQQGSTVRERSPEEEAKIIVEDWMNLRIPQKLRTLENGADYWTLDGKSLPLALRAVAQSVFGCPASAGGVERDFCVADFFMPSRRSSLDPAYLEMGLFLRAHKRIIPNDIPTLTDAQQQAAIPNRFRKQDLLDEVKVLDVGRA